MQIIVALIHGIDFIGCVDVLPAPDLIIDSCWLASPGEKSVGRGPAGVGGLDMVRNDRAIRQVINRPLSNSHSKYVEKTVGSLCPIAHVEKVLVVNEAVYGIHQPADCQSAGRKNI